MNHRLFLEPIQNYEWEETVEIDVSSTIFLITFTIAIWVILSYHPWDERYISLLIYH